MTFDVAFTKRAEKDFENISNYIEREFGSFSATRFKSRVVEFATILQVFPEIGTLEVADKNIRASVIHGRLKVFYRVKGQRIMVLRLFDTRQHPDKTF